jgi:hypothetical protein
METQPLRLFNGVNNKKNRRKCNEPKRMSSSSPETFCPKKRCLTAIEKPAAAAAVILNKKQRLLLASQQQFDDESSASCDRITYPTPPPSTTPPPSRESEERYFPFRPWEVSNNPVQSEPLDLGLKIVHSPSSAEMSDCSSSTSPDWYDRFDNSNDNNKNSNKRKQRNYRGMTRERRIEANARERTRVHTISAAFENLRSVVPVDEKTNQKFSKLSIIRIACAYILALSRLAGEDYSADNSAPDFADCADACAKLIENENGSANN